MLSAMALALASCSGPPVTGDTVAYGVSSELVRQIERRVVMPPGSYGLKAYDRYYSRTYDADVVQGIYLRQGSRLALQIDGAVQLSGIANAYAVEDRRLPIVFDGMCSVVNVEFHLSAMGLAPTAPRDPLWPESPAQTVECGGI